jgi:hypothetical protein
MWAKIAAKAPQPPAQAPAPAPPPPQQAQAAEPNVIITNAARKHYEDGAPSEKHWIRKDKDLRRVFWDNYDFAVEKPSGLYEIALGSFSVRSYGGEYQDKRCTILFKYDENDDIVITHYGPSLGSNY